MMTPLSFRARLGRATYVDATIEEDRRDALLDLHRARKRSRPPLRRAHRRAAAHRVHRPRRADADADDDVRVHDRQHRLFDLGAAQRPHRAGSARAGCIRSRTTSISPASSTRPTRSPDPRIGIRSVLDRLYRGPCRTDRRIRSRGGGVPRQARRHAGAARLDARSRARTRRSEAKEYLESFFRSIEKPNAIKKQFVDGCKPAADDVGQVEAIERSTRNPQRAGRSKTSARTARLLYFVRAAACAVGAAAGSATVEKKPIIISSHV